MCVGKHSQKAVARYAFILVVKKLSYGVSFYHEWNYEGVQVKS